MYLLFLHNYFFFFIFENLSSKPDLSIKRRQLLLLHEGSQENVNRKEPSHLIVEFYHHRVIWYFCYNLRRYWVILHEFAIEGIKIEILIMDQSRDIQRVFRKGASLSGPWNLMSTWFFMWTQLKKNYKWENDWSSIKA